MDGINVDVEQIDVEHLPPYAAFVGRLREALRAKIPDGQVSAATGAGPRGAPMAAAAAAAGADRIFLMAYDYHYGASDVGASAPMDRRDGSERDLIWTLDLYESLGVPVDRTILGLPLYGMRWRVAGPEIGAPRLGDGAIWVPADNPKFLADPPLPPELDPIEIVEFYAVPPTVDPVPGDSRATAGWQAIYVDSPRDPRAEARPRRRSRPGRCRVLGDRVRTRDPGLHRIDDAVRQGRATVRAARAPFVRDS